MTDQNARAEQFRDMHHNGTLVLVNAWDAGSARVLESAGCTAIATTSAGVSWSLGYPDGQQMTAEELAGVVERISRVVSVPVTVDIEAGYGETPDDVGATVSMMLAAGAVGINLEDARPDGTFYSIDEQCERIAAARRAGEDAGVSVVINARIDVFLRQQGEPDSRLPATIERANAYRSAGADCLFVPGVGDLEIIGRLVEGINGPVNIMARPGSPPVPELSRLGVARVSLAENVTLAAMDTARSVASEVLARGTYELLGDDGLTFSDMNALMEPASAS